MAMGRLSQEYTSRNVPVTDAEPSPLKLWFRIIAILIAWLSFPGAFQLLPLHVRKMPFAFALLLAIVFAPFVGVVALHRFRGTLKHVFWGLMLAWLWLLIPASCEAVSGLGYFGLMMLWLPPLNLIFAIAATIRLTKRPPGGRRF